MSLSGDPEVSSCPSLCSGPRSRWDRELVRSPGQEGTPGASAWLSRGPQSARSPRAAPQPLGGRPCSLGQSAGHPLLAWGPVACCAGIGAPLWPGAGVGGAWPRGLCARRVRVLTGAVGGSAPHKLSLSFASPAVRAPVSAAQVRHCPPRGARACGGPSRPVLSAQSPRSLGKGDRVSPARTGPLASAGVGAGAGRGAFVGWNGLGNSPSARRARGAVGSELSASAGSSVNPLVWCPLPGPPVSATGSGRRTASSPRAPQCHHRRRAVSQGGRTLPPAP